MNSPPKMKWSVPNRSSKPMRKSLYQLKALSVAIWGAEIELFFRALLPACIYGSSDRFIGAREANLSSSTNGTRQTRGTKLTIRKIGPLHIKAVENAENEHFCGIFHRTFISGLFGQDDTAVFRILRVDY
jgi:hypothetical protein